MRIVLSSSSGVLYPLLDLLDDTQISTVISLAKVEAGLPESAVIEIVHNSKVIINQNATLVEVGVHDWDVMQFRSPVALQSVPEIDFGAIKVRAPRASTTAILNSAAGGSSSSGEEIALLRQRFESAFEHTPEAFCTVTMLYINVQLEGHDVKAFVDCGAQTTIVNKACAERCNIMRLVDKRYVGLAKGVGTPKLVEKIPKAILEVAGERFPIALAVLEDQTADMLLGLDMMKRHLCNIDLKSNQLVFPTIGTATPFLHESELPVFAKSNQPLEDFMDEDAQLAAALQRSADESLKNSATSSSLSAGEEVIQQHNINSLYESAIEHTPEAFGPVTMLYINAKLEGHDLKAWVDCGAQTTILSKACAERCNLMRLVDKQCVGLAKGVGTQKIIGKIFMELEVAGERFLVALAVLEDQAADMLLGLDFLKGHECNIDLKSSQLVFPTTGKATPFLHESELPAFAQLNQSLEDSMDEDESLAKSSNAAVPQSSKSHRSKEARKSSTFNDNGEEGDAGTMPEIPSVFAGLKLYLHPQLSAENKRRFKRFVVAYDGKIAASVDESGTTHAVIPSENADKEKIKDELQKAIGDNQIQVTSDIWLNLCINLKELLPTDDF